MEQLTSLLVWLPVLFALFAPINVLGRDRFGRAALAAFGPAVLFGLAALIASRTAWGHRESPNAYATHTADLVLGCVILTIAGCIGMLIAGVGYLTDRRRSARRRAQPR